MACSGNKHLGQRVVTGCNQCMGEVEEGKSFIGHQENWSHHLQPHRGYGHSLIKLKVGCFAPRDVTGFATGSRILEA